MTKVNLPKLLEDHGLRATRPRLSAARLIFADGRDRHVTAEWVAEKLSTAGERVALATVYNTLHTFVEAGLMRQVSGVGKSTIIFDTNTQPHHHFFNEKTGVLTDVEAKGLVENALPKPPKGTQITAVDLVIRVR